MSSERKDIDMANIAILTAGGIGSRTHQDIPKQFLNVDNKPIIITFLAMEKVILLCTYKTAGGRFGSGEIKIFCAQM